MKNAILQFHTKVNPDERGVRQAVRAFRSRKIMAALFAVSIFVATAHAGLCTIAAVSQISIQILIEACRVFFAVLQIFGK